MNQSKMDSPKPASPWQLLPDCVILHIFSFLEYVDLVHVALVCRTWQRVSYDEFLWKSLFLLEYKLPSSTVLPHDKGSWRGEFRRLKYCVPTEEAEVLESHTDQVLHVSFSHYGESFASCSKDGYVKVWNATHPVTIRYSCNMREFKWKYTQFSQYNESDTLLLVSGVHPEPQSSTGEIAVFSLLDDNFALQCRVTNKPYDIFGTWYCHNHLLSGDLCVNWTEHLVSSSIVWLNRASQEVDHVSKAVVKKLYRFYNENASSIRTIMIANCLEPSNVWNFSRETSKDDSQGESCENGGMKNGQSASMDSLDQVFIPPPIEFIDDFDDENDVLDEREKYLIFTTGSVTYTPHQVGFKKILPFQFNDRIDKTLKERLEEQRIKLEVRENDALQEDDGEESQLKFDGMDHRIDLHGHIIGMALSPDHRYLYVNNRPWPKGYHIDNPMFPPPIAQEIDIHVIDMCTLKEVGVLLRAHKAYTPNDECFFIFLDVCEDYVASGAEDKHGYVWDRHYHICLAKLPHDDVVNSVAFNPQNEEMLVTVSDDFHLKVWRSKHSLRKIKNGPQKNCFSVDTTFATDKNVKCTRNWKVVQQRTVRIIVEA